MGGAAQIGRDPPRGGNSDSVGTADTRALRKHVLHGESLMVHAGAERISSPGREGMQRAHVAHRERGSRHA